MRTRATAQTALRLLLSSRAGSRTVVVTEPPAPPLPTVSGKRGKVRRRRKT